MQTNRVRKLHKTNKLQIIATIVVLLFAVIGFVTVWQNCFKIVDTSIKLNALKDNAQYYNEIPASQRGEKADDDYKKNNELRQAIYHSDDFVIRMFSNLHFLIKLPVAIIASIIVLLPAFALCGLIALVWSNINNNRKRKNRTRRYVSDSI